MSLDLTPVAAAVSDAAGAEHAARDKWLRAGKALAKAGVTSAMLVRSTEKNPNPQYDEDVLTQVRTFIVQGVSVAKKTMSFDTVVPGSVSAETPKGSARWTVAQLLGLTRDQLKDIDDDVLKAQRRVYMQLIDGPMLSRIRQYIDVANGVEKPHGAKTDKADKVAEATAMPTSWAQALPVLNHLLFKAPTLPIGEGDAKLGAVDLAAMQDALQTALATLRRHVK